jgi:hypothetical protein
MKIYFLEDKNNWKWAYFSKIEDAEDFKSLILNSRGVSLSIESVILDHDPNMEMLRKHRESKRAWDHFDEN